jgi:hypothetical protein
MLPSPWTYFMRTSMVVSLVAALPAFASTEALAEVAAPELADEAGAESPLLLVPLDVGIWPKVSINGIYDEDLRIHNAVSLSLAWAEPHRVEGFQLSLGGAVTVDRMVGAQLGGLLAAAGEEILGLQVGGLVAASGDDVWGAQAGGLVAGAGGDVVGGQVGGLVAGAGGNARYLQAGGLVAAVGGSFHGLQAGGLVAGAGDEAWGVQASGLIAGAGGEMVGLQLGGLIAGAGGQLTGLQAAGLVTGADALRGAQVGGLLAAAGDVRGAQLALVTGNGELEGVQVALLNMSSRVTGTQLGLVNIARHVDGVQLGLVNIAKTVRGASIGAVGYVEDAPRTLDAWTSELALVSAGARLGTRRVTTLTELGFDPVRDDSRLVVGVGLGLRFRLDDAFTLEPELWARGVLLAGDFDRFVHVRTARLRASLALGQQVAIFGGVALNEATDAEASALVTGPSWTPISGSVLWPGAFAGLAIAL